MEHLDISKSAKIDAKYKTETQLQDHFDKNYILYKDLWYQCMEYLKEQNDRMNQNPRKEQRSKTTNAKKPKFRKVFQEYMEDVRKFERQNENPRKKQRSKASNYNADQHQN